jgi:NitT/TauT family transport system permease protein
MRNKRLGNVLLPTVTALVFLAIWQVGVGFLSVPSYLIPTPWSVIVVLTQSLVSGFLWGDIWATVSAIIIGYAVGCTLAFLCAAAVSEFSLLERAFYPLIVAFQSVPKVALAPVIVVWFGFDLASKVVLICLICFFPCFVNTVVGLKSCPTDLIDLYRAFGARRFSGASRCPPRSRRSSPGSRSASCWRCSARSLRNSCRRDTGSATSSKPPAPTSTSR